MIFGQLPPFLNRLRTYAPFIRETSSHYFFRFIVWVPALIFFKDHVGELARVRGASMYPYLNTNVDRSLKPDYCWIFKWKPTEGLERGMIVTFWNPRNPEGLVIKRVIALEGDKVYTKAPYPYPVADIPAGHIWVEGDGANGGKTSLDSNTYGPISKSLIVGKITHVLWPLSSFGPVNWWEFRGKTKVIQGRKEQALQWD